MGPNPPKALFAGGRSSSSLPRPWTEAHDEIQQMTDIAEISLRQAALIAGLAYLVAFLFSLGNRLREN